MSYDFIQDPSMRAIETLESFDQVLNGPGERKKFLEESELPELCTTQPRLQQVLQHLVNGRYHDCITRQGFWRGDPCRPVTVVDTPGLGGEDGKDDEVPYNSISYHFIMNDFGICFKYIHDAHPGYGGGCSASGAGIVIHHCNNFLQTFHTFTYALLICSVHIW